MNRENPENSAWHESSRHEQRAFTICTYLQFSIHLTNPVLSPTRTGPTIFLTGQSATSQVNPAGISGTLWRKRASSQVVIRRNWVIVSIEGCGPLPKGVIQSNISICFGKIDFQLRRSHIIGPSCRSARNQTLHIPQTSFPFPPVPANRFFRSPFYHLWWRCQSVHLMKQVSAIVPEYRNWAWLLVVAGMGFESGCRNSLPLEVSQASSVTVKCIFMSAVIRMISSIPAAVPQHLFRNSASIPAESTGFTSSPIPCSSLASIGLA